MANHKAPKGRKRADNGASFEDWATEHAPIISTGIVGVFLVVLAFNFITGLLF